jgi:pyruvate/oxaloacetate carboxyltransferase
MHEWNGTTWPSTERIMIEDPSERLDRLAKAVVNYRKTLSKNA